MGIGVFHVISLLFVKLLVIMTVNFFASLLQKRLSYLILSYVGHTLGGYPSRILNQRGMKDIACLGNMTLAHR